MLYTVWRARVPYTVTARFTRCVKASCLAVPARCAFAGGVFLCVSERAGLLAACEMVSGDSDKPSRNTCPGPEARSLPLHGAHPPGSSSSCPPDGRARAVRVQGLQPAELLDLPRSDCRDSDQLGLG